MVKITISQSTRGIEKIEVLDHASQGLVCAATSAIAYTISGALINLATETNIKRMKTEIGHFIVEIEPTIDYDTPSQTLMKAAMIGYLQLEKSYPEDINVIFVNL